MTITVEYSLVPFEAEKQSLGKRVVELTRSSTSLGSSALNRHKLLPAFSMHGRPTGAANHYPVYTSRRTTEELRIAATGLVVDIFV